MKILVKRMCVPATIFLVLTCIITTFRMHSQGAVPEPALILAGSFKDRSFVRLKDRAGAAYDQAASRCSLDPSGIPLQIMDYSDETTHNMLLKTFSVKPENIPVLMLVQQKGGKPVRIIVRIDNSGNLEDSFGKILSIFQNKPPSSRGIGKPVAFTSEKDGSEMVLIQAGAFFMGSYYGMGQKDEYPLHQLYLKDFYIDKYEVTNEQFSRFVQETGYASKGGWEKYHIENTKKHPVVSVNYNDALAYAKWAKKRLPTEAEWEKAARGASMRIYPWGNTWKEDLCNNLNMKNPQLLLLMSSISSSRGTIPAGSIPEGASPYGIMDMSGNAEEWTSSSYRSYPGNTFPNPDYGDTLKVARGGSWKGDASRYFGASNRGGTYPSCRAMNTLGFRCAMDLQGKR